MSILSWLRNNLLLVGAGVISFLIFFVKILLGQKAELKEENKKLQTKVGYQERVQKDKEGIDKKIDEMKKESDDAIRKDEMPEHIRKRNDF